MRKIVSALAFSAAMVVSTGQAEAEIWTDFSFNGTSFAPGTVTGRLEFAAAGTGVEATGVYVTSATGVPFDSNANLVSTLNASSNAFTVSADGSITMASLTLGSFYNSHGDRIYLSLNSASGGGNYYEVTAAGSLPGMNSHNVYNALGFAGATYTPEASAAAVPEPATWAMMILGMGAAGYAMRRRQKVTTRVSYAL
jgi:hypothetical protein